MIYNLNDHLFEINKLETISKIYLERQGTYTYYYYFDYQINGFKYTSEPYYHDSDVKEARKKLNDAWETELYYKTIG